MNELNHQSNGKMKWFKIMEAYVQHLFSAVVSLEYYFLQQKILMCTYNTNGLNVNIFCMNAL